MRLPPPERRGALESVVAGEFRRALLMSEDDELPLDENYFGLGLTSLRVPELKQRLEEELQCELDTSLLFSCATVRQIATHLVAIALPGAGVSPSSAPGPVRSPAPYQRQLVSELIAELYEA